MSLTVSKCDCGFGDGFYHFGHGSAHEFNPNASEEVATAEYHSERSAVAIFYGHKDGRFAVLDYNNGDKYEVFNYSEYVTKAEAYKAIVKRIKELWQQPSLF